jgi:enoyl-CoA hydratase
LHEGLERALPELGFDPEVGAIVLTGAGSAFCAGGDLTDSRPPGQAGPLHTLRNRELCWAIARCEAPLIAAVNGRLPGLGATIALMCDVIFMADTALIGDTHAAVGLTAGDGGQAIWPLLVGPHRAKEYLMAGELIPLRGGSDRPREPRRDRRRSSCRARSPTRASSQTARRARSAGRSSP